MRRVTVVLASIALASCATSAPLPARTSSASPSVVVRDATPELVLALRDLPAGYRIRDEQAVTLDALSGGDDRAAMRSEMQQIGFASGYERSFWLRPIEANSERIVAVYLFVYADAPAATRALAAGVPTDPTISRVAIGRMIGDSSHGYEARRVTPNGVTWDTIMVQFEYANAIATIVMQAPARGTMKEASDLAVAEMDRLRTDSGIGATPTPVPRTSPIFPVPYDLALRADDLPTGWKPATGRNLKVDEIAGPTMATALNDLGFRSAYRKGFASADENTTVSGSVMLLGDPDRSEKALHLLFQTALAHGAVEVSTGGQIADESYATEGEILEPPSGWSGPITSTTVYFRSADAVALVTMNALPQTVPTSFVVGLARKLLAHFV